MQTGHHNENDRFRSASQTSVKLLLNRREEATMPRKTIEVAYVRDLVNTALATPDSTLYVGDPTREMTPEQAFRTGVASVLEQILHATDNYRGFQYQESEFNPPDDQPRYGVLREGYDGTRRRYL